MNSAALQYLPTLVQANRTSTEGYISQEAVTLLSGVFVSPRDNEMRTWMHLDFARLSAISRIKMAIWKIRWRMKFEGMEFSILAQESAQAGAGGVCLLPARTDTTCGHDYVLPYAETQLATRQMSTLAF